MPDLNADAAPDSPAYPLPEATTVVSGGQGAESYRIDYWPFPEGNWPVFPYAVEETVRRGARSFSEKRCRYLILSLVLDGELSYSFADGTEHLLTPGQAALIPRGADYAFRTTGCRYYRKLVVELKGASLEPLCLALGLNRCLTLQLAHPQEETERIAGIGRMLSAPDERELPELLGQTYALLAGIARQCAADGPETRLLSLAKAKLEHGRGQKCGIAAIARQLGVCHTKLTRLFLSHTGMSPQAYRIRQRIDNAKHYLVNTSLPIKEIAFRLGYANQLYFSNDFKKYLKQSPKEYRAQHAM